MKILYNQISAVLSVRALMVKDFWLPFGNDDGK
jgi:hypothetical protein